MSISEAHTYDISEIYTWVEQRAKHYRDKDENLWGIMRFQTANILNMVSKKTIKPKDLFLLPSEEEAKPRMSKEDADKIFAKWDKHK